jgi:hypothetical protein
MRKITDPSTTPRQGQGDGGGWKRREGRGPVSRILSRRISPTVMIISLGSELPRTSSDLPEDLGRASRSPRSRTRQLSSYLALHQATLTVPVMLPSPRWALTPPFHPCLILSDSIGIPSRWPSAVCSLWCRCRIAPPGCYPALCPRSPDFPLAMWRAITRSSPSRNFSIEKSHPGCKAYNALQPPQAQWPIGGSSADGTGGLV